MSVYCPLKDGPALYLECLECEDKPCKNRNVKKEVKADKTTRKIPRTI